MNVRASVQSIQDKLAEVRDGGQEVLEIVGNAYCQSANSFHLLSRTDLLRQTILVTF
jgi:hypothetical protein